MARQEAAYPNMTLVPDKRVEDNSDAQEAYNLTMQLKEKYPELKGILGTGSFDAPGAARAIEEMGLTGQMFAISVAMPAEVSDYLKSGTLKSVALWDASVTAKVQLNTAMKLFGAPTWARRAITPCTSPTTARARTSSLAMATWPSPWTTGSPSASNRSI